MGRGVAEMDTVPKREGGIPQGLTVALAGFFPVMAIVSLAPAVPTILGHFANVPGATTLIPLMVTAPGIMIALLSPFAGWAADRYGRRPVLLLATLLYGIVGVLPFFLDHLVAMFALRLAIGVSEAAILTVTNVLIADYFDHDGRRLWLTVQAVIGPVLGVATIVSAGVLTAWHWSGSFLIYLVALPMFFVMVRYLFEPDRKHTPQDDARAMMTAFPWRAAATYAPITLFAAVLYYVFIVQGGLAFAAIGLKDASRLGGLLAIASIGVPVGGIFFNLLSKRLGILTVLALMFAFLGIGMIGIGLTGNVAAMTAASFVQQIGAGMCISSLIFWVSGMLPSSHRGRGFGIWTGAFFLGQFVSPVAAAPLLAVTGSVLGLFVAMGAIAFAGTIFCLFLGAANRASARQPVQG
jgi:MFS family permease